MELITEYLKQQQWRNWAQYLPSIPYYPTDHVIDLGCSVGAVSSLFSERVSGVTGIDLNPDFIEYCKLHQKKNQRFIRDNILNIEPQLIRSATGIWSSFTLTYLADPLNFLKNCYNNLPAGSWIALLDIDSFLSGNIAPESPFYQKLVKFEQDSHKSGLYDFNFGSKMAGFQIIYQNSNITDPELNFDGPAPKEILNNWAARLNRLTGLKKAFPEDYIDICNDILKYLQSPDHKKQENLWFVVGMKSA